MPEAAVDEDGYLPPGEGDFDGAAGKRLDLVLHAVPEATPVQFAPYGHLGGRSATRESGVSRAGARVRSLSHWFRGHAHQGATWEPHGCYRRWMARQYGKEFPERPLMSTLSDLLGIPHFSTARGSTVRTDFLQAVGAALGVPSRGLTKDELIRAVWEGSNRRRMPEDRFSPGGTVTNRVLQEIIDGILDHGLAAIPATPPNDVHQDEDALFEDVAGAFDPAGLEDERTRRLAEMARREGRNRFRTAGVEAYGARCAVTDTAVPAVLDAAHIAPYRGQRFNVVPNGLCLRRDIHSLFDRGMLAVHEHTHQILLTPVLLETDYEVLGTRTLRMPRLKSDRPSVPALRAHRLWAGLDRRQD